jgi:phasin protein
MLAKPRGEILPIVQFNLSIQPMERVMAESKSKSQQGDGAAVPGWSFPDLATAGSKNLQSMFDMQSELLSTMADLNKEWLARATSHAQLTSQFIGKLSEARTIPDAAQSYQDCIKQQMEMLTDDTRRVVDASRKIWERFAQNSGGFAASS